MTIWGQEGQGWSWTLFRSLGHGTSRVRPCLTWVLSQADLRGTLLLKWGMFTWLPWVTSPFSFYLWWPKRRRLDLVNGFNVVSNRQWDPVMDIAGGTLVVGWIKSPNDRLINPRSLWLRYKQLIIDVYYVVVFSSQLIGTWRSVLYKNGEEWKYIMKTFSH